MRYGYGYFEEDHLGHIADISLWRRILSYIRPHWVAVLAAVILSLLISATGLTLPYLIRVGIDRYITNGQLSVEQRIAGLGFLGVIFIAMLLAGFVSNFLQVVLLEWTGQRIMHRMRQDLFLHLLMLDLSFFNRNPVGKLVTRLTNDIQNMHDMFTSVVVTLFNDAIRITGILAILFWMNWRLTLLLSLLVPLMLLSTVGFSRLARHAFRSIRTHLARINSYLQEALSGIDIIQLFLRQDDTHDRFVELNEAYYQKTLYQIKIFGFFMPLIEVMSSCSVAIIIWFGGKSILHGSMTVGILVAFLSYMRLFFQPLRELSQKYSIVQSAMASAERIFQLLDTHSELPVLEEPKPFAVSAGRISFNRVSFGYQSGRPVLEDISLHVKSRETLAIVGPTGSGKTTLINLLERFYDPDSGTIEIDGIDLRHVEPKTLRRHIGMVMQDVFIVPGSLRENILLDQELEDDRLNEILEMSQLSELVRQLPEGVRTRIGEGGMDLSAGQKQLLAIARVLARNPGLLVLDEATSNVDSETEVLTERAIESALAQRTSIVIAHRLSTIRRADRIVVVNQGRIVEEGTHEQLMVLDGFYRYLQDLQNNRCEGFSAQTPTIQSP